MGSRKNRKRLLTMVLCMALLLTVAGCKEKTAETVPAEAAYTVQTEVLETTAAELQTNTVNEDTVPPTETVLESAAETEAPETVAEQETENIAVQTEPSEETVLKSQYDELEEAHSQLKIEQEKSDRMLLIVAAAAILLLVVAMVAVFFWVKSTKLLKKQEKKNAGASAVTAVTVGKVHGIGKRSSQQDCFTVSDREEYPQKGVLAVVADGMGGLENGDQASQTAVMAAVDCFLNTEGASREKLVGMLAAAKSAMDNIVVEDTQAQCGTTLVLALLYNGILDFVSVGDSRICLYRNGMLFNLNREHSYQQELFRSVINGEKSYVEAVTDDRRGCIVCYLGMGDLPMVDIPTEGISVRPGDKLVLMSDGVYNALSQRELCLALQYPAQDAAEAIESFIHSRNFPDQDNYTAVILECE